jgi:hypothetical protein
VRRAPAAAAALALGLAVTGCGGGKDDARARVSDYINRANAIQRTYAPRFRQANRAYVAFAKGKLGPRRAARRLSAARRSIAEARDRLAALRPPAQARALQSRLLRYLRMNVAFARQTAWLADYQRAAPLALTPLRSANADLRTGLQASSPADQAAALAAFATSVDRTLHRLRGLAVPDVLRPANEQRIRQLRTTRSLAGRLRGALIAQDTTRVAQLLLRFRQTATPTADRKEAVRAIGRYNRRFHTLTRAYADVRREQIRLDRSLG